MELFDIEQEVRFLAYWKKRNVEHDHDVSIQSWSDDDRIDYKIWEDLNWKDLYKKHLPDTVVIRGENPNLIFHGGCLGCLSQRLHGIDRCKGCEYFRFDHTKPNLHIKGESASTMTAEDFNKFLGGTPPTLDT